jgi:hypothetical protein
MLRNTMKFIVKFKDSHKPAFQCVVYEHEKGIII